ncbi:MAG: SLBB domain-containing protein [Porticoccaceae bacterium]
MERLPLDWLKTSRLAGKTPSQLARDIEAAYSEYVKSAVVSVIVGGFQGVPSQQVRVIGEAANPLKVPYSKHMTLLDLMVEVGGLTEFADGNDAVLVRQFGGEQKRITFVWLICLKTVIFLPMLRCFPVT